MLDNNVLVSCIFAGLACVVYFFYWNRLLALIITLFLRVFYWKRESSRVWFHIGSIHFSLLAGRILLKDVHYYSGNQTFKIVKGQIQWRYWIRRPTSEDELSSAVGEDAKPPFLPLACRIHISLQGLEWFLYNRTAAYDNIISQMEKGGTFSNSRRESAAYYPRPDSTTPIHTSKAKRPLRIPSFIRSASQWIRSQLPSLDPMDLFPIGIEAVKGVIVLGSQSTPYLLISEFQRAEGTYGYVTAKSKLDPYRTLWTIRFRHAIINYMENESYIRPMPTIGQVTHDCITQYTLPDQNLRSFLFSRLWHQLKLFTFMGRYTISQRGSWQRKPSFWSSLKGQESRKEGPTPIGIDFTELEYAKDPQILEAPVIDVSYYCDAPGQVPFELAATIVKDHYNMGNGDSDPEWGIDIAIYGGLIKYGPWADRQRGELQRLFFPSSWQDVDVTPRLKPGDQRSWTALQIVVELRDNTMLQIPFREASKDWQWDGKCEIPNRPRAREPACIQITAGDRSSIRLTVPMIVGNDGYESTVEVHLDAPTVTSSLNDIKLVHAESCRVRCEMPTPLRWNGDRTWHISVTLRDPVLYLIRDHINMLIDLGKDWAYGPPHDYPRFIPTIYVVDVVFHHYNLNMYLNDNNIIDRPHIRDENVWFTTTASHIKSKVTIPANVFRPEKTTVSFVVEAPDPLFRLSLPRWNTYALHAPKHGNTIGRATSIRLDGSYLYFSQVKQDNVDQLHLKIMARGVVYKALGWAIRYFLILKDNYFGSFTQFSTLSEFLKRREKGLHFGDPISLKYRPEKANMLQVTLVVDVVAGTIVMPAGLPGYESTSDWDKPGDNGIGACLVLFVPEWQMHLRLHDHFMEMSLNTESASGYIEADYPENLDNSRRERARRQDLLMIDGIDIVAYRLFGPQPRNATYVCLWEINFGQVRAMLSALDMRILGAVGNTVRVNFTDMVNAPSSEFLPRIEPDVTFVKVSVKGYDATWRTDRAALSIAMPNGLTVTTNDLGGQLHQKVTSVRIPDIDLRLLIRSKQERSPWLEAALFKTHVSFDVYAAPHQYREHTRKQIKFIQEQDRPSGRAQRTFGRYLRSLNSNLNQQHLRDGRSHLNGVFLPQPAVPDISQEAHPKEAKMFSSHNLRRGDLTDSSASDADTAISEAERDARLAKARGATPLPDIIAEEETMTSGDESDDADLTDSSSDSIWFDEDTSDALEPEETLLVLYSRFCRHYESRMGPAAIWEGPPFILAKDRKFFSPGSSPRRPVDEILLGAAKYNDDCNVVSFRIEITRITEFRLTPLIIPAMRLLENDMEQHPLGPELSIDSLLIRKLDEFLADGQVATRINWTIKISCITLQIGQHITMADDSHPIVSLDLETIREPSMLDEMTIFEVNIEDLVTSGTTKSKDSTVQCALGSFLATMKTVVGKPTAVPFCLGERSLEIRLETSACSMGQTEIDIDLGHIKLLVGQRAPEFSLAAGLAMVQTVQQARTLIKQWQEFIDSKRRTMLYNTLASSRDHPILEPLSTIQPSYLVQRGIPRNIRTGSGFKFLFHLRDCLWDLHAASIQVISPTEIAGLRREVELRARALDPDISASSIESLLRDLGQGPAEEMRQSTPNRLVSIKAGGITATIVLPSGKSGGQFLLSGARAVTHAVPCDIYRTTIKNLSQTSLRSEKRILATKTMTAFALGDITLTLFPHTMTFFQHIARLGSSLTVVGRDYLNHAKGPLKFVSTEVTVALHRLHIQAAADNLIFELGVGQVRAALSSLSRSQDSQDKSTNNSIFLGNAHIRARSTETAHSDGQDILAALELTAVRSNIVTRQEPRTGIRMRLVWSSDDTQLNVPRSALRLYRFIEEWRDDYLPGIESTFNSLLSEWKGVNKTSSPKSSPSIRPAVLQLHGKLGHFGIALQVMHGTWVSWEVQDVVGYLTSANTSSAGGYTLGLQISSMAFCISTKEAMQVKMTLPPFTVTGRYDGLSMHMLALVGFIELKIKPVHWDKLLTVQQKFGQDFNDLLSLMQETRSKRATSIAQTSGRRETRLKYGGYLKVRGFRVGLEGVASTLYLECRDVRSGLDSAADNAWHIALSNLALSLAPRSRLDHHGSALQRRHRSAFVIIDIMISAESRTPQASLDVEKRLRISVTKIHAVMQASSVSEISDFVDELHLEVLSRKDQRSHELAEFKEKARNILKTFEVGFIEANPKQTASWLDTYVIDVVVQHVGIAIPLTHGHDLQLPGKRPQDPTPVRAFLFSVAKIEFGAHRGETGQAAVTNFSFQFVPRFRQSVPNDFLGENHQTRNRLLYPEMRARIQSQSSTSRQIWMGAIVSGFILDFDSTIPEYVFLATDVYHRGRESVERISAAVPLPQWSPVHSPLLKARTEDFILATSRVFASLRFSSGKIRLFSEQALEATKSLFENSKQDIADEHLLRLGAEIFNLPQVSVWAEYRTTPPHRLDMPISEPSTLMFKSTVHSSENALRPNMLHFLTEVVSSIESRLQNPCHRRPSRVSLTAAKPSVPTDNIPNDEIIPANLGLKVSFSLRIDRSKLELTCLPDVNVMAGLNWESGGFVVNIFPAAQKVTIAGTVSGLTAGLKHGFLSEDCVKLDARNLAFIVTFARLMEYPLHPINCLSVVLDTELLGGLRFSRLQDVLCFKAVWLDNIPVLNSQTAQSSRATKPAGLSSNKHSTHGFTKTVLVRIRQIKADIDLGQSISTVTLDLYNAVLRTRLSDSLREWSVSVQTFMLNGKGNVAGCLKVQDCVFQTSRRTDDDFVAEGRMLDLRMTSGPVSADLQSEHQKLLRYRAEPLAIEIYDDWSEFSPDRRTDGQPLRLAFTVACSEILAVATVGTIPRMMAYANRFEANLKAQREGASRESAAFSKSRTPVVSNPLSTVAEAMLHSARTRLTQAESNLTYLIRQHMSFRLDRLQLIAFPRTMEDPELASFIGENLRARLNRIVASGNAAAQRDLYLSFSALGISRYSQVLHHMAPSESQTHEWFRALLNNATEATIIGLPAMSMHMLSEERLSGQSNALLYDFNSEFIRHDGTKQGQDIFITLNMSLYSWLTVLRKNLTREMEQVRNAAERKPTKASSVLIPPVSVPSNTDVPLNTISVAPKGEPLQESITPPSTLASHSGEAGQEVAYIPRSRHIERLTMRQLGEATPDVMHPFFMKKSGFNLEESLPQYVNEYATVPLEEIMEVLLKIYSRRIPSGKGGSEG